MKELRINQIVLGLVIILFLICAASGYTNGTVVLGFMIMASLPAVMIMTIKTNKTGWFITGFIIDGWCLITSIVSINNLVVFLFFILVVYDGYLLITRFKYREK